MCWKEAAVVYFEASNQESGAEFALGTDLKRKKGQRLELKTGSEDLDWYDIANKSFSLLQIHRV